MPTASISSMKTMQWPPHLRASFLALWPIHCTATTSMPMKVWAKPEPGTAMKGALKPVAIALASIVLPVPGGPMKSRPRSGLPPDCLNWSLACHSSMILRTSSLTSAWPRTWSISTPQLASPGSYDFICRTAMSTIGTMKIAPIMRLIRRMNSSCARSAAVWPFQKLADRGDPVEAPDDAVHEVRGIAAQHVEDVREDAEERQVADREAPDEAPERDAPAQRRVLLEERLVGAEQARPRDEAVGDEVEGAARGRERAPRGERGVQLREPGVVAIEHPDGGDRDDRDEVRDSVERAPLQREPDAGAARDEPAGVASGSCRGAETTALLAFRCSGACSAGVVGCSIGCSILRRRRAPRDPK